MPKGDFYVSDDVLKKFPELNNYFIGINPTKIGISASGNVKYAAEGGNVSIIRKEGMDAALYKNIFSYLTGNTTARLAEDTQTVIYDSELKDAVKIDIGELRNIGINIYLPNSINNTIYVIEKDGKRNIAYYVRKKKKSPLCLEIFNDYKGYAIDALCDAIDELKASPDNKEALKKKIAEVNADWQEKRDGLDALFQGGEQELGNVEWHKSGICVRIYILSPYCANDKDVYFRFDRDIKWDVLNEFIVTKRKEAVENLNKKREENKYRCIYDGINQNIIHDIRIKYNTKLEHMSGSKDPKLVFHTTYGGKAGKNIKYSITVNEEYIVPKNAVECRTNEKTGVDHYKLTEEGQTFCRSISDKIVEEIAEKEHNVDIRRIAKSEPCMIIAEREIVKYDTSYFLLYSGTNAPKGRLQNITYNIKTKCLICKMNFAVITIDNMGNAKIEKTPVYKKVEHEESLARHKTARTFFEQERRTIDGLLKIRYMSGKGVLFGDTKLKIGKDDVSFDYFWKSPSYKDSLTIWKKTAKKNIAEIGKFAIEKQEEKEREDLQRLGQFAGDYIAIDAANFIIKNELYITENAAISYLRGLTMRFRGEICDTGMRGKYKLISSDDIEDIIDELIRKKIIVTKSINGTYGYFDILKSTPLLTFLASGIYDKMSEKDMRKQLDEDKPLIDSQADDLFNLIREKQEREPEDYVTVLKLCKSKGFVCTLYSDYVAYLKSAPDEIKEYIKMRKEMTEDAFEKKILIAVLKK